MLPHSSCHDRAAAYTRSELFKALSSFAELEFRIAHLTTEKELAGHDRSTVVMVCGIGKTLVVLWAAEQAEAERVLVLMLEALIVAMAQLSNSSG